MASHKYFWFQESTGTTGTVHESLSQVVAIDRQLLLRAEAAMHRAVSAAALFLRFRLAAAEGRLAAAVGETEHSDPINGEFLMFMLSTAELKRTMFGSGTVLHVFKKIIYHISIVSQDWPLLSNNEP